MPVAPLVAPAGEKVPKGTVRAVEGANGVRLRTALFAVRGKARGSVMLSPGRTESIEKYYEVIGELNHRRLVVLAHDWRGQGGSQRLLEDRLAGHAGDIDDFLEDYRRVLAAHAAQMPRPRIAMGHSMGGCLTLLAAEAGAAPEETGPMDAVVLSAPMLCLRFRGILRHLADAMAWSMVALGMGRRSTPGPMLDPLGDHFEHDRLTHDHARYLRAKEILRAEPTLALGQPTWGWLKFALAATRRVRRPSELAKVAAPVLIVGAGADRLCESEVSEAVAAGLPDGRYVEVPGAFHEILMETDERRAVFWEAFDAFVGPIISQNVATPSAPRPGRRGPPQ